MQTKPQSSRIVLARHLAWPVILLALLTIPWLAGGRGSYALLINLLLTFLLVSGWYLSSRKHPAYISFRPYLVVIPLASLLLLTGVSTIWSVSRYATLGAFSIALACLAVFAVSRDLFKEAEVREIFLRIFILIGFLVAIIGLGMFVLGDYERATSLFYWPNPFATYLLALLAISFQNPPLEKWRISWVSAWWYVRNIIFAVSLYLTFSRAAWLILLLIIGLLIWRANQRWRFVRQLFIILLIAALIGVGLNAVRVKRNKVSVQVTSRITESAQSTSVKDRFSFWREGVMMFAARPTGWGSGTFAQTHTAFQEKATTATNNPHNSLVQTFAELGMLGAALYLIMLYGILKTFYAGVQSSKLPVSQFGSMLAVLAIGLHSLFDLISNYPVLLFLLMIFLAMALGDIRDNMRTPTSRIHMIWFVFPLLLILAIFIARTYAVTQNEVRQDMINAISSLDREEATRLYHSLIERPALDPVVLSTSAIYDTDTYDMTKIKNPGTLQSALRSAQRAVQQEPYNAVHYYALANVQQRLGKDTEALKNYQKAVELDPHNNPQYQVSLALLLQQQGFTRQALSVLRPVANEYTEAVLLNRSFASNIRARIAIVYTLLARLENESKNADQARRDIERALELNPRYVPAQDLQKQLQTNQ